MADFDKKKINEMNILSLSFLGDAVYTLFVREKLVKNNLKKVGALSASASHFVNASAQEKAFFAIESILTKDERLVASRARNANFKHFAKNFSIEQYRHATALEAVFGFLLLMEEKDRLNELLEKAFDSKGEENEN